jgi:hypothetical protein
MNHDLICTWLGLPFTNWPPDHYHLLGLEPGETDTARIEQQVHQRLEGVRRYQLTHPDLVTEAMNRLAQAFVCLTDPAAKRAYDTTLFGTAAGSQTSPAAVAIEESPEPLAWLHNASEELVPIESEPDGTDEEQHSWEAATLPETQPAASRLPQVPLLPAEPAESPAGNGKSFPLVAIARPMPADDPAVPPEIVIPDGPPGGMETPAPEPEKADTLAAEASAPLARRGLGTKRGLYRRIARTRKLLQAWEEVGKYLAQPQRRVVRPAEATDLIRQLARIRSLLRSFPAVLGEAGQPGYLVVALARQETPVPTFQTLLPSQRVTLAQHWEVGYKLLAAHRQFLRQEIRKLRRRGRVYRSARAIGHFLVEYPEYVLFALALLALTAAMAKL